MNKKAIEKPKASDPTVKYFLTTLMCLVPILIASYLLLDRPIAYAVNNIHLPFNHFLIDYTQIKPWVYLSGLVGLFIYFLFRTKIHSKQTRRGLLVYSLAIVIANAFKDEFKFAFGRDWPKTWYHHNASLIHNKAYGFHWLHGSMGYSSFPSGHMTVMTVAMTALCIYLPKFRWLWISIALFMAFSLLFLDYHFLSDIIAGSFWGISTALCVNHLLTSEQV